MNTAFKLVMALHASYLNRLDMHKPTTCNVPDLYVNYPEIFEAFPCGSGASGLRLGGAAWGAHHGDDASGSGVIGNHYVTSPSRLLYSRKTHQGGTTRPDSVA